MQRLFTAALLAQCAVAQVADKLQYVNPLIGTANGGDVFPGASLPYGVAKPVADTNSQQNQGGFTSDGSNITGFSSMHDSGTGGLPSLGLWPLFPFSSCTKYGQTDIDGCAVAKEYRAVPYINQSVKATPGYFGIELQSGVKAEMTATFHTSLYRFTFPSNETGNPAIVLDLSDLSNSRQDNSSIHVDDTTGRMTGCGRFEPSFGVGTYVAYFCADFKGSQVKDNGIYVNTRGSAEVKDLKISRGINGYPLPGGGFVRFEDRSPVLARVGLSFESSDQACQLAEAEIPDFDFNSTYSVAVDAWRKKFDVVDVATTGVNSSLHLTNFYSGIYRTMINPQNYTGINGVVGQDQIYFDSYYCIWDLFRSQTPWLIIFDTQTAIEMVQGLLTLYGVQGWLPDCHMSLSKGYTQGGSNADIIISDVYQKVKTNAIDWNLAYEAVQKDAEEEPYDWCCNGRGGLDSWASLNYIPQYDFDYKGFGTMTRSCSRTLEYAYDDYCISLIAAGMNNTGDKERYIKTSEYWYNLWKADQTSDVLNTTTSTGFVGYFQPKFLNQTWGYQNPLQCSNLDTSNSVCSLQANAGCTFESSIWEYSFFVPHDMGKLIALMGGPNTFVNRLNYMHDQKITYIGNEPAFLTVVQYHYAGRPAQSAKRIHFYIPSQFMPTPGGLPGNDDSGTMGAFMAFSMIGLSTVPGQNVYLITPPFFESVNITSPVTGKTATIRNVNFDPSYNNIYIQRATLNGVNYTKNWIDHSFFEQGKELVLYLGANESSWGTHVQDLPPSLSPYQF